jgi:uncharacterized membrane protein YkvA (DUF1232 family)
MFDRFKLVPHLWRTGRLTLRLLRDPRVPFTAKLVFYATVAYMLSPIDIVPDWIPVLGQADDLVAIMAGLNLFLRAVPNWLVAEHEDALAGRRDDRDAVPRDARSRRAPSSPIEGTYRPVR